MITTDRRSQFQSTLFTEITNLLGVKHISNTVYHPCANSLVERYQRQLKTALTSNNDSRTWLDNLPLVSIRNVIKEDLGCTTSGQFCDMNNYLRPNTHVVQSFKQRMSDFVFAHIKTVSRDIYTPNDLHTCVYVFIRNDAVKKPLCLTCMGPYQIIDKNLSTLHQ